MPRHCFTVLMILAVMCLMPPLMAEPLERTLDIPPWHSMLGDGAKAVAEPREKPNDTVTVDTQWGGIEIVPLNMGDSLFSPKGFSLLLQPKGYDWTKLDNPWDGAIKTIGTVKIMDEKLLIDGGQFNQAASYIMVIDLPKVFASVISIKEEEHSRSKMLNDLLYLRASDWGFYLANNTHTLAPNDAWLAFASFRPRFGKVLDWPESVWVLDIKDDPPTPVRIYPSAPEKDITEDGRTHSVRSNLLWSKDSKTLVYLKLLAFPDPVKPEPSDIRLMIIDLSKGLTAPECKELEMQKPVLSAEIRWVNDGMLALYEYESVNNGKFDYVVKQYINLKGETVAPPVGAAK